MKWCLDLVERSILGKWMSFGSNGCDRLHRWDFMLPAVARRCWKWVDVLVCHWHYEEKNCSKTTSSSCCKFSKPVASFPGLPKFSRVWFRDYRVVYIQSPSLAPRICPASIACKTEKRERAWCLQDSRKDFNCAWVHQPQTAKRAKVN